MKSFQKADGHYGILEKGKLIPETVSRDGLEIGRFEITEAQFVAFDPNYKVQHQGVDYPASGITFDQAKAYCQWLSQLTGQNYRLATEAEVEPLYKGAKGPENTLDFWAGYQVNPDDAKRLDSEVAKLGGKAPLLKPVGSFKPSGKDNPVFDLGGNVAEWVVGKDSQGKTIGGSADLPADPKVRDREPAAAYIGFRVVKAAK